MKFATVAIAALATAQEVAAQSCGVKSLSVDVDDGTQNRQYNLVPLKIIIPQGITPKIVFEEVVDGAAMLNEAADPKGLVFPLSIVVEGATGVDATLVNVPAVSGTLGQVTLSVSTFGEGAVSGSQPTDDTLSACPPSSPASALSKVLPIACLAGVGALAPGRHQSPVLAAAALAAAAVSSPSFYAQGACTATIKISAPAQLLPRIAVVQEASTGVVECPSTVYPSDPTVGGFAGQPMFEQTEHKVNGLALVSCFPVYSTYTHVWSSSDNSADCADHPTSVKVVGASEYTVKVGEEAIGQYDNFGAYDITYKGSTNLFKDKVIPVTAVKASASNPQTNVECKLAYKCSSGTCKFAASVGGSSSTDYTGRCLAFGDTASATCLSYESEGCDMYGSSSSISCSVEGCVQECADPECTTSATITTSSSWCPCNALDPTCGCKMNVGIGGFQADSNGCSDGPPILSMAGRTTSPSGVLATFFALASAIAFFN